MTNKTRKITLSAVLTALTVVFLYIANLIPTSRVGIVAVASLFAIAAVIETGMISSILVFVGSSVIGVLLLPDKTIVLIYLLFFGYYPVVKSFAERLRSVVVTWVVKLAVFETALTIIWFLFRALFLGGAYLDMPIILIYLAGSMAFVIFDIGLSKLIGFYIARISKNIRKNNQ